MVDFLTLENDSASSPTLGFDNSLGSFNTYDPNLIPIDLPTIGGGFDPGIEFDNSTFNINNFNFTNDIPSPDLTLVVQPEPFFNVPTIEQQVFDPQPTITLTLPDPITGQIFDQLQPPVVETEPSNSELTPPFDELINNPSTTVNSTPENSLNINNQTLRTNLVDTTNPFFSDNSLIASEASNPLTDKELPC